MIFIFFMIMIILSSGFIGYLFGLKSKQEMDVKLKAKVDEKGNIYFLKQYFIRGFLFKVKTIARYSVEKNEFQVY